MADAWHVKWLKEGVEKWNKRRKKVEFEPDLSGLKFFDLLPPDFRDAPKTSRYFEKIDLSKANLSSADMSDLNFANANFANADMSYADLSMSNFSGADFTNANLIGVNSDRSYFLRSTFQTANLIGASFVDANTNGAVFIGSIISDVQRESMSDSNFLTFTTIANYHDFRDDRVLIESKSLAIEAATNTPSGEIKIGVIPEAKEKIEDERKVRNRYDVFFGTSRNPILERGALVGFGPERATELSYGICEVIVPEGHRMGSLGSRWWKRFVSKSDDRLRIEATISLNFELFWSHINQAAQKFKLSNRPTIFIHGFNNTFEHSVLRAAQIGFDLGLGQGIGLFSWPSKGKMGEYSADEAASEASKYFLADFIRR